MNPIIEVIRYLIFTIFSIINGILCSAIVVETSEGNNIKWHSIPETSSFKLLLITLFLMVICFVFDYKRKNDILNKIKNASVNALVSSDVYVTLINEMKKAIKNNDVQKFDRLDSFRKKIEGWAK